ncbi:hypothetical protein [Agrococcus sp. Marseille-Q4369]|uniref:hypothetical protein n=1 Tax=Agrococcus sp. Marseille-Q4369 TaxID=2810513 RepID=UPI001B8C285E|nr:hypothetical protein [Agrococcus sp. Marseille-Q4369]QUW18658.1 hypothetical protein JSQ78_12855 [Agrococcus sp. Marseille-Q4369]
MNEFLLVAGGALLGWIGTWLSDRRAAKRAREERTDAKREAAKNRAHEKQIREQVAAEARLERSEAHARERVAALLEEYIKEIGARHSYRMDGEDGRDGWVDSLSHHFATAQLIPDREAREALTNVVEFIGELAGNLHATHLLDPHQPTYADTIYSAALAGRDVCAEWLRAGNLTQPTKVHVEDFRKRLLTAPPGAAGPAAAGDPEHP